MPDVLTSLGSLVLLDVLLLHLSLLLLLLTVVTSTRPHLNSIATGHFLNKASKTFLHGKTGLLSSLLVERMLALTQHSSPVQLPRTLPRKSERMAELSLYLLMETLSIWYGEMSVLLVPRNKLSSSLTSLQESLS